MKIAIWILKLWLFLKLGLEGRRQYDPFPEEAKVYQRLGKTELRRSWMKKSFFSDVVTLCTQQVQYPVDRSLLFW